MPRPYFSLDAPDSGSATPVEQIDWLARFAAARADRQRHREERRRAQAEFAEARRHGLAARHATKLARIHAARALGAARGPEPCAGGHFDAHDPARAAAVQSASAAGGSSCAERVVASAGAVAVESASAAGGSSCAERDAPLVTPAGVLSAEAAGDRSACPQSTVDLMEAEPTAAPAPAAAEPESTPSTEPAASVLAEAVGSAAPVLVEAVGPAMPELAGAQRPEPAGVMGPVAPVLVEAVGSAAPEPVAVAVAVAECPVAEPVSRAVSATRGRGIARVLRRRCVLGWCVGRVATPARWGVGRWSSVGRRAAGGRAPPACIGSLSTSSARSA